VAIGDSLAQSQGGGCAPCTDYVHLYGQAVSAATGVPVDVQNLASIEFSALPGVQATSLLNDILSDTTLRHALAGADVIVISVGFNDTPWNRFDNPCDAANADLSVIHWDVVTPSCIGRVAAEYKRTLDEILTQIDELRGCFTPAGQPLSFCKSIGKNSTIIRIVTVFNDWIGDPATPAAAAAPTGATDRAFVAAQCFEMSVHGGQCADAYHTLNGSKGTADAGSFLMDDHTHLNQSGHQAIAAALSTLGFAPLQ
jgi:lysophospholipase L1-like esterase